MDAAVWNRSWGMTAPDSDVLALAALKPARPVAGARARCETESPSRTLKKRVNTTFSIQVPDLVVARARRGEAAAIEELVRTFEVPVFTLARRLVRDPGDAEDILQETFLEMTRSLPRFRGDGSFAGWLRRITTTKGLQKLRQAAGRPELDSLPEDDSRHPGTGDHASSAGASVDLRALLERLPDAARAVVWLHEVEGFSHEEIATLMGMTPSFSKSQLQRAVARLRDWLDIGGAPCI